MSGGKGKRLWPLSTDEKPREVRQLHGIPAASGAARSPAANGTAGQVAAAGGLRL